jgi:hypothetical protein
MEEGSGICLLGQLIAQGCAGADEGLVAPVTFILNMGHAGVEDSQRPAAEGAEYCPARRPENTVAPAQAGAHDVCLARPTGAIGPSLRWGDGGSRSGCHKAPPLQGRGGMWDQDLSIPCRCAAVEGRIWYTYTCTFAEWP